MKYLLTILLSIAFAACSSFALNDPHFILDPPNHNLRGKAPKDDRPESDCDPLKQSDGSMKYLCVVHTMAGYANLLKEINRLETELKSCQSSR